MWLKIIAVVLTLAVVSPEPSPSAHGAGAR
jgi:hypothetical protein